MKRIITLIMFFSLALMGEKLSAQDLQGGGVYADGAQVTSSVISGNIAEGQGTGVYATNGSTLTNNTIVDNKQVRTGNIQQKIGDVYEGGVIFYMDANTRKGLIVALSEAPTTVKNFYRTWGECGQNVVNASDLNDGKGNSATLIANQVIRPEIKARDNTYSGTQTFTYPPDTARRAVHWCTEYKDAGLTDWFLPSREQLVKLYAVKSTVNSVILGQGGTVLSNGYYWSSTQADAYNAWYVFFDNGEVNTSAKSNAANVRPIREFNF